ncbi:MAG TPA: haloacid dehalogenase-like hydrolase [Polyangiaceae bacterium]|jgi:phosphoserine phosphatase
MQVQSVEQILERIGEAARAHPGGVVAFDGDGTLWSGDVGEDFFHGLVAHGDIREPARAKIDREAADHGLTTGGSGKELAARIYADYLAGRYPEEAVCELMTWAFADWTHGEVDAFAAQTVVRGGVEGRLHPEVKRVVAWAKAQGIEVFLVSASPVAIIEHAGKVAGIDADHVVAALPRYEAGRMVPDVHRPIPYGPGKVKNLRARIGSSRPLYAAFGDNAFDIAMLSEAFIPVAVRPKPRLRERAGEVQKLVEIARES